MRNNNDSGKNTKKKGKAKKIIIGVIAAILGIVTGLLSFGSYYKNYLLSHVTYVTSPSEITIVDESGNTINLEEIRQTTVHEIIQTADEIHNFLLIGMDSRSRNYNETGTGGLSDVTMVMSVNSTTGTIKMISIARDSYVHVPGYSNPMKINAAMSLGGPDILCATVEDTLRINIDGWAYVNFYHMAEIIDAVGGVYCDVSSSELYSEGGLNWNLLEVSNLVGGGSTGQYTPVANPGYIWLNGPQAVAYARIRKIDSDYMRSERQVEVLRSLMNQFISLSLAGKVAAIPTILSAITTNIPQNDIENYALNFLPSVNNIEIQYMQLPIQGCFSSGMYGDEWSIRPNWNAMIPYVQEFFYGETTVFDPVPEINHSPSNCPTDIDISELLR
ncbi:MAG: LCP family protein [Saccharofermentans sp.]|nr:LCP family protein [Saccharofermentans sp.]